jgi:hypothetical protein
VFSDRLGQFFSRVANGLFLMRTGPVSSVHRNVSTLVAGFGGLTSTDRTATLQDLHCLFGEVPELPEGLGESGSRIDASLCHAVQFSVFPGG